VRQFAGSGFRIWNLSREAKLVYTGFGVCSLLAILVSGLLYEDMVGARGTRDYYRGGAAAQALPHPAGEGDGPKVVLAPDGEPAPMTVAMPYRKLLEVTHFHLFTVPIFLLVIAHLFMLTGLQPRTKALWIVSGFAASLLHLAAPWLVRYGSARLSLLFPLSGAAMALTLTVMTAHPLFAMWRRPPAGE